MRSDVTWKHKAPSDYDPDSTVANSRVKTTVGRRRYCEYIFCGPAAASTRRRRRHRRIPYFPPTTRRHRQKPLRTAPRALLLSRSGFRSDRFFSPRTQFQSIFPTGINHHTPSSFSVCFRFARPSSRIDVEFLVFQNRVRTM